MKGTAHAAGASMLSLARGVFAGMRSVRVRYACGGPGTDCKSAQLCTTRGHPLPLPQVTSGSVQ